MQVSATCPAPQIVPLVINPRTGKGWTDAEEQSGKAVCVIGNTVRQNLFPNDNPIGQNFRVKDLSCEVIGTLSSRGQGGRS